MSARRSRPGIRRQRAGRVIDAALWSGLVLTAFALVRQEPTRVPATPLPPTRVDLETSPPERLMLLPGVGRQRARAIVQARRHGLETIDDLERVRGIGPATVDRIRQTRVVRITVGSMPR